MAAQSTVNTNSRTDVALLEEQHELRCCTCEICLRRKNQQPTSANCFVASSIQHCYELWSCWNAAADLVMGRMWQWCAVLLFRHTIGDPLGWRPRQHALTGKRSLCTNWNV